MLRSPTLVGHQDYFMAPLSGSIALFISILQSYSACHNLSTMDKKGYPKVPILPSTTRKGTVLSTSVALYSTSVISKFASPPLHASHAISVEFGDMSDTFDDASTILDETGSLGPFLESKLPLVSTAAIKPPVSHTIAPNCVR